MSKLASAESLTQTGYTLGTPEYMAPEQCIGAQVEPRTDIYALGVMMYEALTGELPIVAQNRRELLDLHQRQIPTPMRQRRPDLPIPEALDLAVMKCLKKRLNERPKSAAELEQLLAAVPLEGLPKAYPPGTSRRAPRAKRPPTIRTRARCPGSRARPRLPTSNERRREAQPRKQPAPGPRWLEGEDAQRPRPSRRSRSGRQPSLRPRGRARSPAAAAKRRDGRGAVDGSGAARWRRASRARGRRRRRRSPAAIGSSGALSMRASASPSGSSQRQHGAARCGPSASAARAPRGREAPRLAEPRPVLRAQVAQRRRRRPRRTSAACSRDASASASGRSHSRAAPDDVGAPLLREREHPRPDRAPRRRARAASGPRPRRRAPAPPARAPGRAWRRRRRACRASGRCGARSTRDRARTRSPDRTMRDVRGATRTSPTNVPLVLPSSTSTKSAPCARRLAWRMAHAGVGQAHVAARAASDDDALRAVEREPRSAPLRADEDDDRDGPCGDSGRAGCSAGRAGSRPRAARSRR